MSRNAFYDLLVCEIAAYLLNVRCEPRAVADDRRQRLCRLFVVVDFNFIYDKVEALYSNTGRPSVDPVMLIKMMLIGYLYGIESERKLEQEVRVNIA